MTESEPTTRDKMGAMVMVREMAEVIVRVDGEDVEVPTRRCCLLISKGHQLCRGLKAWKYTNMPLESRQVTSRKGPADRGPYFAAQVQCANGEETSALWG